MNVPYFLIPIFLTITLYYIFGSLLAQAEIISMSNHRKFWNFILLFVFLGCAVLGVLLVININYKLEWRFVKALLRWHVQLGIAMSAVALIHTLWHSSYFSKYLSFKHLRANSEYIHHKNQYLVDAFALGLLSVSLQVLLIRQFTKVFQGNEFLITWIICIWMILSGIGAFIGNCSGNEKNINLVIRKALWFMFFSATLFIYISGEIKQTFFPSGVLIAPHYIILMVTLMMFPTAILSGLIYAMLTGRAKGKYPTIYALEALGSLLGGLLLSLVIIWFLNTYLAAIAIGFIAGITLAYPFKKPAKFTIPLALMVAGIGIKIFNVDIYAESILLNGQKVLLVSDSPYGSLTVTGSEEQVNFFGNGSMLFGTENPIYCEESIHYIMAQRALQGSVLLISGGYAGLIDELAKYSQVKVDYVEPNPHLLNICKKICKQPIPKNINVTSGDIRGFLRRSKKYYDVAIVAIGEPTSLEQNRYFTLDFLKLLKQHLTPSGIVSFNLHGVGNYPSPYKIKAYSSITATVKEVFKNVEVITGERDYLLASDSTLRIDLARLLSERHIGKANLYVRPEYINDEFIAQRNLYFHEKIALSQNLNTDNHPWPILHCTLGYLSMFGNRMWLLLIIGIFGLLIPVAFVKGGIRSMYVVGFAGSSIQTLYLLTLQVGAGILYGALGAMIALFMGGLAGGAILHGKPVNIKSIHAKALLIISYLLLVIIWIGLMRAATVVLLIALQCLGTLMASLAIGYLYVHFTNTATANSEPARTYAADLLGSAAGIVVVTLLLIPSIGVISTASILALSLLFYLLLSKG